MSEQHDHIFEAAKKNAASSFSLGAIVMRNTAASRLKELGMKKAALEVLDLGLPPLPTLLESQ